MADNAQGKPIELMLPAPARITEHINRKTFPDVLSVTVSGDDPANSFGQRATLKPDQENFEIGDIAPGEYKVSLMGPQQRSPRGPRTSRPLATIKVTLVDGKTESIDFDQK